MNRLNAAWLVLLLALLSMSECYGQNSANGQSEPRNAPESKTQEHAPFRYGPGSLFDRHDPGGTFDQYGPGGTFDRYGPGSTFYQWHDGPADGFIKEGFLGYRSGDYYIRAAGAIWLPKHSNDHERFYQWYSQIAATLGPSCPKLMSQICFLAVVCKDQGEYAESELLFTKVFASMEKMVKAGTLNASDKSVSWVVENYRAVLLKAERIEETAKLEARATAMQTQLTNGTNSSDKTQPAGGNKISSVSAVEDSPLWRQTTAISDSYPTALEMAVLAHAYMQQGEYAWAEPLFKKASEMDEVKGATAGCNDSAVLWILDNYAELLQKVGRPTAGVEIRSRAATIRGSLPK